MDLYCSVTVGKDFIRVTLKGQQFLCAPGTQSLALRTLYVYLHVSELSLKLLYQLILAIMKHKSVAAQKNIDQNHMSRYILIFTVYFM